MRFHVVALPHTQVTEEYAACAFTQKVLRFCQMMKTLGHEVFLYAGEQSDHPVDELITCISEDQRASMVSEGHYTSIEWGRHIYWSKFNETAIAEMGKRLQQEDFICLIGGIIQKPIADAFPSHISVEFGIGYSGTFAKYRVFESYAWMHMLYGAQAGNPSAADGIWYDAVIPNQIDPALFPNRRYQKNDPYYLYVGRLIDRKGYKIAQELCESRGKRLVLAGPGPQTGYGEFVGEVDPEERAKLMSGAQALFAPTIYVEPFGTVTIEAMACGTPVICTDWGAFTETVEQGVDGMRCRIRSEFVKAMQKVESGQFNREKIRSRAMKRFGIDIVGKQYEAYFKRLLTLWGVGWPAE